MSTSEENLLPSSCVHTLKEHVGAVYSLALTLDGSFLMSGGNDKTVRLWDANDNLMIKEYKGHGFDIHSIQICNDNSSFASAGSDRCVYIWDVKTGANNARYFGHTSRINSIAYNNDCSVIGLFQLLLLFLAFLIFFFFVHVSLFFVRICVRDCAISQIFGKANKQKKNKQTKTWKR